ncbi:transcription factor TFIIIB component B'' homolog isoform X3 [Narcine bancroftii]|uniref:transcription factor TFIIIB component B'' homolog isoform X3 n=1 Tax=Narcine bancroftii TaxID=1343680 RepID=UPI00383162E9
MTTRASADSRMFRRSRLSIRPNVKPGGRGSSQTFKGDDKALTSDQQLNSEGKTSNEKEDSEIPAASGSFPSTPLPHPGVEQEERDDPNEQQENVPLNKNEKNDKTGESGAQGKPTVPPLQRRKRFSTMPNLAKPRSTSLSAQQSTNLPAKSQQQNLSTPVTNVASILDNSVPLQTTATEKILPKSPEKRKTPPGKHVKLPEKKTPIPQVPQFSPVKNTVHKDSAVGTSSTRVAMTRKALPLPLKERITPSSTPTKGIVPSPSISSPQTKPAKVPSDLERLRKARKLRQMLKEEMKKEKKAHRETIPIWENDNPPERTKMTMRDFIYFLPDTNPMLSSFEEERRPSFPVPSKEPEVGSISAVTQEDEESDDAVLGPRVKVAEDGSIIIDEESLTVEVLRMKTSNIVEENDPIFERGSQTTYSSFRKSTHTKPWSDKETDMFFLAISMVGTDFSMIGQLFPNRSRIEIKNKFKREEKLNSWRIDKAFKEKKPLDLDFFGELLTRVLEGETKRKRERNRRDKSRAPKRSTAKRSRKSKKLKDSESDPDDPDPVEAADHELAEADTSATAEITEASGSLEGTQDKEVIPKPSPIENKRKRKKNHTAETAEKEIAKEISEKDDGVQKSNCKVRQRKKGVQKALASVSGRKDDAGKPAADGEDESQVVTNSEMSSDQGSLDQGSSEIKQPAQAKSKEKTNEENKSLSETVSRTTTPVTWGSSNKSQLAQLQKLKTNSQLIRRKNEGEEEDIKIAPNSDACDNVEKVPRAEKGTLQTNGKVHQAEDVKESPLQNDSRLEEPTDIKTNKQSEKDVSSVLIPETIEDNKVKELSSNKRQDSDTESRFVEKPEEPKSKPGRLVRSRFQRPKPNLGRAVVKRDMTTQEIKIDGVKENKITTQDMTGLSPDTPICKVSEAQQQTTRILDNVPIQNQSGGTEAPTFPASLSKSQSVDASFSDRIESKRKNVTDLEPSKSTWDSHKGLQSEKTSGSGEQNDQEELMLASIQENIISKPTRSGRQPKPTIFYNPSANKQPPDPSVSEGENESKIRSRSVQSHKAKPKINKISIKKEAQAKTAGKGQGKAKMTLVTLRASHEEEDDDDESDVEEEDDIYSINPEEVNKAPAFVPIGLRSPEPVQAQVEETMEELEIEFSVSDKSYTSEAEHSLLELRDKSEPNQSCTFIPEEDCHPTTADQIELFVEVIEVPSKDPVQEEDHCSNELGDGLQDAAFTDVICVEQKNLEEESALGSGVPSLQIFVCSTHSANDESITESNGPDKLGVPAEKKLKDELDVQTPSFSKEDSTKVVLSSSVTEESDGARRRYRFAKPKPNLSKSTSRSYAIKPCPTTDTEEMLISVDPTGIVLQKEKPGNNSEINPNDSLSIKLMTEEDNEENIPIKKTPVEQPNSKIPDEQDKFVSEEQMNKAQCLDNESKYMAESLNMLESDEQNKCVEEDDRTSRTEHLGGKLTLFVSDEQDRYVEEEEKINRTGQLESGAKYLTEQLCFITSDEKDKHMTDKEQIRKSRHLDNRVHDASEKFKTIDEQENATEHLDDDPKHLHERVSLPHIEPKPIIESQDIKPGISSDTYLTQSADQKLSIEATETPSEVLCEGYSKIDKEPQNMEHQEALKTSEENLENLMAVENSKEETFILTLVEIPASSLTENSESSASFTPVSENALSFAESYPPLSAENTEIAVSSESLLEEPTVPTVLETLPIIESSPQQYSSNMPQLNMGQMDRKRKADDLKDDQNYSTKKNPVMTSRHEGLRENVPQTEKNIQSNSATFVSFKDCSTPSDTNTLDNYDIATSLESGDDFTFSSFDDVLNNPHVERLAEASSVFEEMKVPRIRRGKITGKPNFSTKRVMPSLETDHSAQTKRNNNTLKLSETPRNTPTLLLPEKKLQTEAAYNSSFDVNSTQHKLCINDDDLGENEAQDAPETAMATELFCSPPDILAAVTEEDTAARQTETSTQDTAPSSAILTRPGRKPRGFLSFISKKSSEGESEVKPKRMRLQKPHIHLPQLSSKKPIPPAEDAEDIEANGSPTTKTELSEKAGGSKPNTSSSPTGVKCNSSLQSWQSESYTEEACCAMEQDTHQMLPTKVAEYFFSDIFTEVDEQE